MVFSSKQKDKFRDRICLFCSLFSVSYQCVRPTHENYCSAHGKQEPEHRAPAEAVGDNAKPVGADGASKIAKAVDYLTYTVGEEEEGRHHSRLCLGDSIKINNLRDIRRIIQLAHVRGRVHKPAEKNQKVCPALHNKLRPFH